MVSEYNIYKKVMETKMCGIAGISDYTCDFVSAENEYRKKGSDMIRAIRHRGPDDEGIYITHNVMFAHARLAVIDVEHGRQPMTVRMGDYTYAVCYNGEIYNYMELREELEQKGVKFVTYSDTEVILRAYIFYGTEFVKKLNGIFAIAIYDEREGRLMLFRDRMGVKPLYYVINQGRIIFASEIKALFASGEVVPEADCNTFTAIFATGPATMPGSGVFKNVCEVLPGYMLVFQRAGIRHEPYWQLEAYGHHENYEETLSHTRELLVDSIKRQMVSDVPLCTLLSGGVDSSLVSFVAAYVCKNRDTKLTTYSFDYVDNNKYFRPSDFQPGEDAPYVKMMVDYLETDHRYLFCDSKTLYESLYKAVDARDLPGMADVDSSLLYFAGQIKQNHTVCLSGECADEIFGGYPWFRDEECMELRKFPWSKDTELRKTLVNSEIVSSDDIDTYTRCAYESTIADTPVLFDEDDKTRKERAMTYLNIKWFMQTLLKRKDMMTMASGLEVRVPFADHRLVEYVYNVPWSMKYNNGVVKSLLRDAFRGAIPDDVLYRRKSPYPKTYNPEYEQILKDALLERITDVSSPLRRLINVKNVMGLINGESNYTRPWFGQLMAGPQTLAYLLQIDYWLVKHGINV